MEKKIKMGIVGAGTWGRTHAYIYREHSNAEPVAICDMNRERAQAIADEFGIKEVYTDYHEMAEKAALPITSGTCSSRNPWPPPARTPSALWRR